jgi:putative tryptophan/tyrosine transport system substrate-binding protein
MLALWQGQRMQFDQLKRREFITLLGSAAIALPLAARAQQSAVPVIGFLRSTSLAFSATMVAAFRQGLTAVGFNEGQNVAVEYRFADNQLERLPGLVAELLRLPVEVIVANVNAALAAKAATTTVPIVFATGSDPIVDGLVASLNRPGGNVTGVSFVSGLLGAKRFDMLRQLVPSAATMAMLVETDTLESRIERRDVELAAQALGQQLIIAPVSSEGEFDGAFASIVGRGAKALLVGTGPLLTSNRERVVGLAARHAIPAIYALREFVVVGGLMSYGASIAEAYRQVGIYAGRVLKGEKPADLPVMQSTKFELMLNLKTAKALGLVIPPTVRALADEVIE